MTPDFETFLKKRFWWVPRRPAFYLSALWVGSQIGAYALAVGLYLSGVRPQQIMLLLLTSPQLFMGAWMRLTGVVMIFGAFKFADVENLDLRNWAIFTGVLSLLAMLSGIFWMKTPLALTLTWTLWVFLIGALVYTVWFFERLDRNRWAVEIAMLKADNASQRAHAENAAGFQPSPEDHDET